MKTNFNFESVPLNELRAGTEGIVTEVDDSGPAGRRLLDLGLLPDTRVRAVRRAPLGDPVAFELRGYVLCLRRSEAARIRVRVERAEAHSDRDSP